MKHFCLLFFLFITIHSFSQKSNDSSVFKEIYSSIEKENYFKAKDIYLLNKNDLSKFHQAFIEANLDYGFNQAKLSNCKIEILKRNSDFKRLADSVQIRLYNMQMDNYVRLYQYSDAENVAQKIKNDYPVFWAKDSIKALALNDKLSMFHALRDTPKQEVIIKSDDSIQLIKDVVGLKDLKVTHADDSEHFVFDTGAGFSLVSETTAKKFKMHILDGLVSFGTAAGKSVKVHIAACDDLNIKNIKVKNAVFFVVDDSAYSFPQLNYQIHGIIGFPVIEALKEIQITKDDKLIIPKNETVWNNESNAALSNNKLYISINDTAYGFDTGASSTWLNKRYYDANKKTIEAYYQKGAFLQGNIGGIDTVREYLITFCTTINGKKVVVPNVNILTKDTSLEEDVYGRIGQDFIHQFDKMTINFDKMFIKFE